jgi:hypothetical protein
VGMGTVPFSCHSLIHRSVVSAALLRLGYAGHLHIGMCLLPYMPRGAGGSGVCEPG